LLTEYSWSTDNCCPEDSFYSWWKAEWSKSLTGKKKYIKGICFSFSV